MSFRFVFPSLSIVRAGFTVLAFLLVVAPARAVELNSQEQQIFNSLKSAGGQGRPFAVLDPVLCRVARQKAADMANRGYYSHTNPDGYGPNWLVRQAGYSLPDYYDPSPAANNVESVNAGRASAGDAWSSWMDSSGHRVHLLGENSFYAQQTSVGVGFVDDPGSQWRYYWVVITAPPSGPTLSIKSPKAGLEITSDSLTVSGTTDGKPAAARVEVCLENASGTSAWIAATGTTSWSITLTGFQAGSNTVRVRSVDSTDAVLDQVSRTIRYVVLAPLNVQVLGRGSVSKGFEGVTEREVGRNYRITARPAAGALFAGWTGSLTSNSAIADFVMSEGFSLTANFVENPFVGGHASYSGLSTTSTGLPALLTLKLGRTGRFSGKLKLADGTIPLRGVFDPLGHAKFTTTFKGQAIAFELLYGLIDGVPSISGSVTGEEWTMPIEVGALGKPEDRSTTGRYTLVIRANPNEPTTVPQGDGFATTKVSRSGLAKFIGQLADGTPFSVSGQLTRGGALPVFLAPYHKKGAFAGTLNFRPTSDVDGQFLWMRPAQLGAEGFTTSTTAVGGKYESPKRGEPVVRVAASANNTELELGAGGLSNPVLQPATLSPDNSVTVMNPALPGLSLSIKCASGQFQGHFIHPATGASTTFRGVVVQKENACFGFFVANGSSGYATLVPTTEL